MHLLYRDRATSVAEEDVPSKVIAETNDEIERAAIGERAQIVAVEERARIWIECDGRSNYMALLFYQGQ